MKILGISEGSHDACWALYENGEIKEAHHVERHNRIKNYPFFHRRYLPEHDIVVKHENFYEVNKRRRMNNQKQYHNSVLPDAYYNHHDTHAWAGYATSKFEDCDVLVVDAIGEWETATVHQVRNGVMKRIWQMDYPQSLGLVYSATTAYLGFKPMEEEYIVMGLAAFGEPTINVDEVFEMNCHRGIPNGYFGFQDPANVAASIQKGFEDRLLKIIKEHCHHENLVYMGGCALNCVANSKIEGKNIWIMPNPGDGGSCIGAIGAHIQKKIDWHTPFLGTKMGDLNPKRCVQKLLEQPAIAYAVGRTEFGPRALGGRSLLMDPRQDKSLIDTVKRRQKWRPFSPAILEEFYDDYYEGPANEYMQFVSKAKHDHKAVIHVDGTSRVQIVKNDGSPFRLLLEEWYEKTRCPMLLNTSLNVKGEPIVNTFGDYERMCESMGLENLYDSY